MIFHEIYGYYYQVVAKLLTAASDHALSKNEMRDIISQSAFAESSINIEAALTDRQWPLLNKDSKSILQQIPELPITNLEKRWLKTIALDSRAALFGMDLAGLEDVEPIFEPKDIYYFDRYLDGDNYANPVYVKNFNVLRHAIRMKHKVAFKYLNRQGQIKDFTIAPLKIEYSDKEDKMRVLSSYGHGASVHNLDRIKECHELSECYGADLQLPEGQKGTLVLTLWDERKTLERFLMRMAHHKKQVIPLEDNRYRIELIYDVQEDKDILIQIMGFGRFVQIVGPEVMRQELKRRLKRQLELLDADIADIVNYTK